MQIVNMLPTHEPIPSFYLSNKIRIWISIRFFFIVCLFVCLNKRWDFPQSCEILVPSNPCAVHFTNYDVIKCFNWVFYRLLPNRKRHNRNTEAVWDDLLRRVRQASEFSSVWALERSSWFLRGSRWAVHKDKATPECILFFPISSLH